MDGKLTVTNDGTQRMELLTMPASGNNEPYERVAVLEPKQSYTITVGEGRALFAREDIIPG